MRTHTQNERKLTPAQARVVKAMSEGRVLLRDSFDGRFRLSGQDRAVMPQVFRSIRHLLHLAAQSEYGETYRLTPAGVEAATACANEISTGIS